LTHVLLLGLYFIDDASGSVSYTGPKWQHWNGSFQIPADFANGTKGSVVDSSCYEHTVSLGQCYTSDNCAFTITFIGSGITVFLAQGYDAINASIQLDEDLPNSFTLGYPDAVAYNVPFYNKQSLPVSTHFLTIRLESWDGSNGYPSSMLFDYAEVNETAPSPSPTPTPSAPASSKNSPKSMVVAAAITAVVVATVSGLIGFTICFLRSRKRALQLDKDECYPLSAPDLDAVHDASTPLPVASGSILAGAQYVDARGSYFHHSVPHPAGSSSPAVPGPPPDSTDSARGFP